MLSRIHPMAATRGSNGDAGDGPSTTAPATSTATSLRAAPVLPPIPHLSWVRDDSLSCDQKHDGTPLSGEDAAALSQSTVIDVAHRPAYDSKMIIDAATAAATADRKILTEDEEATLLEREAFGGVSPEELEELFEGDLILTRRLGRRVVHFLYKEDVDLFDDIVCAKFAGMNFNDAFEKYAFSENGDALVRIAYVDNSTHWDAVLKYEISKKDDAAAERDMLSDNLYTRALFEREMLRHRLFIVRDRGVDFEGPGVRKDGEDEELDVGQHFILVMASFDVLALEAERIKLRLPIPDRHKRVREHVKRLLSAAGPAKFRLSSTQKRQLSALDNAIDDITSSLATVTGVTNLRRSPSEEPSTVKKRAARMDSVVSAQSSQSANATVSRIPKRDIKRVFVEGYNSIGAAMQYMLGRVPGDLDNDVDEFKRANIHEFINGNMNAPGFSRPIVMRDFFSTARRNHLVRVVIERCKIIRGNDRDTSAKKKNTSRQIIKRTAGINDLLHQKVYISLYALHDGPYETSSGEVRTNNDRARLFEDWYAIRNPLVFLLAIQPLRRIRDYFGEKVAFYFSFLSFYSLWLYIPSIIGIAVTAYGIATSMSFYDAFDHALTTPFALIMSLWCNIMLVFWRRQENTLKTVWDVYEGREKEDRRPEWYGTVFKKDGVTGKIMPHFPSRESIRIRLFTSLILFIAILAMVGFEVGIIFIHSLNKSLNNVYYSSLISASLTLFNIVILTPMYLRLAYQLNVIENHKTNSKFDDALVNKTFIFSFVNNYSAMLYLAIIKVFTGSLLPNIGLPVDSCGAPGGDASKSCLSELMFNVAIIFVGLQFITQLQNVAIPFLVQRFTSSSRLKAALKKSPRLIERERQQHIRDDILQPWSQDDEFGDKLIQFGFVALFSCGFPLAPLLALVYNVSEVRLAAYRIVVESKRPFVNRVAGVGAWFWIAEAISRIAIVVNAAIIAFSSRHFNDVWLAGVRTEYRLGAQLLFIIGFEHLVLFIVYVIDTLVPNVPSKVRKSQERQQYLTRLETGEEVEEDEADVEETYNKGGRWLNGIFSAPSLSSANRTPTASKPRE